MFNQIEIQILKMFLHQRADYLTGEEIGQRIGVSDKTSRKYLREINAKLDNQIAEIVGVRGYGNQLMIHDDQAFRKILQTNITKQESQADLTDAETPKERQNYLLRNLFFEERILYFEDLLAELYISETVLAHDLAVIKKILQPFELSLINSQESGLAITGKEQNKRHFIMNHFLIDQYQNNQKSFEHISLILENVHLEEILIIVLDEYRNEHLQLNDTIILNVAIHIALALMRVHKGYPIQVISNYKHLEGSKEVAAAKNIINRLENVTDLTFPDAEIYNIALHLKNKQSLEYMLLSQNIQEGDLKEQIIQALNQLEETTGHPYITDKILVDGLMTHFVPLLLRIKNQTSIKNPFLDEIKTDYPTLFQKITNTFAQIDIVRNQQIPDDEWAYIALHIIAAHERKLNNEKRNVLVICATGLGSSQMIGVRLENEFGSKINIKNIISYYELTEEQLTDIDLIISTIDLSNTVFSIPIVQVSVLLNNQDIQKINQIIAQTTPVRAEVDQPIINKEKQSNLEAIVDEYFTPDLFIYSEDIQTKQAGIDALITQSITHDPSINRAFLENQLRLREKFSSVVFTEQIAIPHPIEGVSNKSKVAVLLTPKGMNWEGESQDIQLTLLLLPDRFGQQQIESVSKALLPLLDSPTAVADLVTANNFATFKQQLIQVLSE